MRVILPRIFMAIGVVVAIVAFSGCGASAVTRPRLERSLPVSFANQYVRQAAILGHKGITVDSLNARAQCDKGGPEVADVGPGADWICFMSWRDPNVPNPDGSAKFELNVHSNNCYTTTGPTKLVGLRTITDTRGTFVDNPVFEFDTCFDPQSSNAPTGVTFPPAALQLPAGVVRPDNRGEIAPVVTCTIGPLGCSGRVTAQLGSQSIGQTTYSLAPGGTSAIRFAVPGNEGGRLTLVASPTLGGVINRTAVLRVPRG